jgi:hypothetical protein
MTQSRTAPHRREDHGTTSKQTASGPEASRSRAGSRGTPGRRLPLYLGWFLSLCLVGAAISKAEGHPGLAPIDSLAAAPHVSSVRAIPLTGPVRIDGRLDEPVWSGPGAGSLVQNDPDNGRAPRQRTEWWIAYDDDALYFACRLYDSAPESIACGLGRRDSWPSSDWITLNIDTFNDDRTGYEFCLSPAGAFVDAAVYNDGAEDVAWDAVWSYQARVDSLGWAVELRIPFSQIKLPDREAQTWGINVSRRILRYQERDDLMHIPRGSSGYVSLFPDLTGLTGIHPGRRLEFLSYGVARGEFQRVREDDPFRSSAQLDGDLGTDVRWPLTNDLTLNATFNPDFGQVEVDPAVINLSDNETYYEEHRPFFIDDANQFRSGSEGTDSNWNFNWMDPLLFYSRRVGRPPQVSLPEHDFADTPGATTILGATKAVGTVGRYSAGILTAWTAQERARLVRNRERSSTIVEPSTNYSAARILRTRTDGRRGLGLMATNTWRSLDGDRGREELTRNASVVGLDGWTRLDSKGVWALRGYLDGSRVTGTAAAIDALQRSAPHYYRRPDAGHLHYDSTRTTLDGFIGRAVLNKQSGNTTLNMAAGAVSPGFDANDTGFSNRADAINWSLAAGYRWPEPNRAFRNCGFNLASYYSWDTGWNADAYGYGLFWYGTFTNYWDASGQFFYNPPRFSLRATRGGPTMRVPDNREMSFNVGSDDRKKLCARLYLSGSQQGDGSGSAFGEVDATLRVQGFLRVVCAPAYSWSRDHSGWVGRVDDPAMAATYGARYLFGTLTYQEASLSTRVDCTFTPRLTLQAYLQPLIGVGSYRGIKELARPRSYEFNRYGHDGASTIGFSQADNVYQIDPDGPGPAGAFTLGNPDFNSKSLKVNLVLRWEYMPGSTFFLVWTQNRTDDRHPGDFRLGRDARSLLDTVGGNSIQAKVTKWWGV